MKLCPKPFSYLNNQGVTLVEIMVVAGIVSIISMAITSVTTNIFKAQKTAELGTQKSDIEYTLRQVLARQSDLCGNAFLDDANKFVDLSNLTKLAEQWAVKYTVGSVNGTSVYRPIKKIQLNNVHKNDGEVIFEQGKPSRNGSLLVIDQLYITRASDEDTIKLVSKYNANGTINTNTANVSATDYNRALYRVHLTLKNSDPTASFGRKIQQTYFHLSAIYPKTGTFAGQMEYCYLDAPPLNVCRDILGGYAPGAGISPECILKKIVGNKTDGLNFQIFKASSNDTAAYNTEAASETSLTFPLQTRPDYEKYPTKMRIDEEGKVGINTSIGPVGQLAKAKIDLGYPVTTYNTISGYAKNPDATPFVPKLHVRGDLLVEGAVLQTDAGRTIFSSIDGDWCSAATANTDKSCDALAGITLTGKKVLFCALRGVSFWDNKSNNGVELCKVRYNAAKTSKWEVIVRENSADSWSTKCAATCLVQNKTIGEDPTTTDTTTESATPASATSESTLTIDTLTVKTSLTTDVIKGGTGKVNITSPLEVTGSITATGQAINAGSLTTTGAIRGSTVSAP